MPYHKYVFDVNKRKFVGKFEEMYQNEDKNGYDSWYQEDLTNLSRQISLAILNRYNFSRVLDVGCGKGTFTHLLKKANNEVVGIDVSETAIEKARAKYRNIDFKVLSVDELMKMQQERYDLVIMLEVLSYLENWRQVIKYIANITRYVYVSLYIPADPVGFVKNFENLRSEITKYFNIEVENLLNNEVILVLGVRK